MAKDPEKSYARPGQVRCETCLSKDKVEFKFFFEPLVRSLAISPLQKREVVYGEFHLALACGIVTGDQTKDKN